MAASSRTNTVAAADSVNDVRLIGRLSGAPTVRTLPSGDEFTVWRLVVGRSGAAVSNSRAPTVDTIDCAAHKRSVQRLAAKWASGDVLEVNGALRRRFWRGAQGLASRYEVEVSEAKRLRVG
jgi:single-strand DNA-binding protein